MLIPRQFSDHVYDLDKKVYKEVYCLGGPDVERWKCNPESLDKMGYSKELKEITLDRCCSDVEKGNKLGYSETIHLRHLDQGLLLFFSGLIINIFFFIFSGKIPVAYGRFPVFLTRRLNDGTCHHGIE
jgi:hypothetical protein